MRISQVMLPWFLFLTGFIGCVQYFNVTGYTLPVSGHSVIMDVWPSATLVQSSCRSPGVCFPLPCSEEYSCLSELCQNRWTCGPAVQNSSCICLHNVSDQACDVCSSTIDSNDGCSEAQGRVALWLTTVIVPLMSIVVITGMFVSLYRVRQQNAKCQSDSSPQKTEQGTDNMGFCFDDHREVLRAASAEKEKQHDPMSSDQQRSSVEYYEIGSICGASFIHSDTTSLQLSLRKHLFNTERPKAEPKRWGDLQMLLAGQKKECLGEGKTKHPTNPENVAQFNAKQSPHTHPCYENKFPQREFLEPAQCLTLEEISKLNSPPAKSSTISNFSSDSETDTTVTGVESYCSLFSNISTGRYRNMQTFLSGCSFRQQDIMPVSVFLQNASQSTSGQHKAENNPCILFEPRENILNMHLPFSSYAPVFEDIACLPIVTSLSHDTQSDLEETI